MTKFKFISSLKSKFDEKLKQHPNLRKIIANMGWLSFDRLFQLFVSFIVVIWVIRYLGPEQFGLLSYSWAFVGLFSAFTFSSMSNVLIRELVKNENKKNVLLGSAFIILLVSGSICFFISLIVAFLLNPSDFFIVLLIGLSAFSFFFNAFNVIDYWFQSKVQAKYVVISRNIMLFLVSLIKIFLIIFEMPLVYFAFITILEGFIFSLGLVYFYFRKKQNLFGWKFDWSVALGLIKESWPLIFSTLAILIYMRIDQVMLGQMMNMSVVGVYSVAVKLSEFAVFIPGIIVSSIAPSLINSYKNNKLYLSRFRRLYDFLFLFSLVFALILYIFSTQIVNLLYGNEYILAAPILEIYAWSIIPMFLNTALMQYFIIENKIKFSFYVYFIGAFLNVLLNILLIPTFGAVGAAVATVIAYFATLLGILIFKETRQHGLFFIKSFNLIKVVERLFNEFKGFS